MGFCDWKEVQVAKGIHDGSMKRCCVVLHESQSGTNNRMKYLLNSNGNVSDFQPQVIAYMKS
jgi:hypothetical protein